MEDSLFWEVCNNYSVRSAVADFIEHNKKLSSLFREKEYYELEDGIVDLIKGLKDKIYRERNRELIRDDVVSHIKKNIGNGADIIIEAIPLDVIDNVAKQWNQELDDNDYYFDIIHTALDDAVSDKLDLFDLEITEEQAWMYAAYLDDWYSAHTEVDPDSIEEFFHGVLEDDTSKAYYESLAKKYKAKRLGIK